MRKLRIGVVLVAVLVCGGSFAHGQRATERFIPLGRSPGVSGKLTTIGTIVAVHPEQGLLRISSAAGPVDVTIPGSTPIWIDRHALGLATLTGSLADCREGLTAEVKYADPDTRKLAEWVKVELRDPESR
jgi:hypothetical protein